MTKVKTLVNFTREKLVAFKQDTLLNKCDIISLALLWLFFVDCSFSGGGKYLAIGPITFRMIAGIAAFLFAIPKLIVNMKKHIKNPIFYMFFAFLIWLVISACIGIKAENNMNVLITDIKGFMWLFVVVALIVTVDTKKRFGYILNAIVIGAFIQAGIVLVVHFGCCLIKDGIKYFYNPMLDLQIGIVNIVSNSVFRIFMRSGPYMILACGIAFFKQMQQEKIKIKYILTMMLFLFCCLLSFTRSLFGCAFIVLACCIIATIFFYKEKIKLMLKTVAFLAIAVLVCTGVMEFIFDASYLSFAISRTFGTPVKQSIIVAAKYEIKNFKWEDLFESNPSTDNTVSAGSSHSSSTDNNGASSTESSAPQDKEEDKVKDDYKIQQNYIDETKNSDTLRLVTKQELKALVAKSPIIGNGLGACSQTRNGPDEYFYYDMLARMGIIGLLLYVAPFIYVCFYVLRKRALLPHNMSSVALLCGMVGFWGVTWFNPWMNAVLGIAVYALTCSIFEVFTKEN